MKAGLIAVNKTFDEAKQWVMDRMCKEHRGPPDFEEALEGRFPSTGLSLQKPLSFYFEKLFFGVVCLLAPGRIALI